ncbi:MAG TPA: TetR/AcrR family transcriptional regulator [Actinomycetota bacterium]|nr:TetR/AcrR family transcriptional regulator [Actinomycetota bacterium]
MNERLWDESAPDSARRIVLAALEAFAERGYHGTTTRDIARRANLSPAGIYMHYRSKEELLELIMRAAHQEVLSMMREAFQAHPDPVERMRALVDALVRFHATWYTAARVANHELPALSEPARARILKLRREVEDLVEEAIEEGLRAGVFSVRDRRVTTFAILSMGIGVSRWFRPDGRLSPEELGSMYGELVVRMLSSGPAAAPGWDSRRGKARAEAAGAPAGS